MKMSADDKEVSQQRLRSQSQNSLGYDKSTHNGLYTRSAPNVVFSEKSEKLNVPSTPLATRKLTQLTPEEQFRKKFVEHGKIIEILDKIKRAFHDKHTRSKSRGDFSNTLNDKLKVLLQAQNEYEKSPSPKLKLPVLKAMAELFKFYAQSYSSTHKELVEQIDAVLLQIENILKYYDPQVNSILNNYNKDFNFEQVEGKFYALLGTSPSLVTNQISSIQVLLNLDEQKQHLRKSILERVFSRVGIEQRKRLIAILCEEVEAEHSNKEDEINTRFKEMTHFLNQSKEGKQNTLGQVRMLQALIMLRLSLNKNEDTEQCVLEANEAIRKALLYLNEIAISFSKQADKVFVEDFKALLLKLVTNEQLKREEIQSFAVQLNKLNAQQKFKGLAVYSDILVAASTNRLKIIGHLAEEIKANSKSDDERSDAIGIAMRHVWSEMIKGLETDIEIHCTTEDGLNQCIDNAVNCLEKLADSLNNRNNPFEQDYSPSCFVESIQEFLQYRASLLPESDEVKEALVLMYEQLQKALEILQENANETFLRNLEEELLSVLIQPKLQLSTIQEVTSGLRNLINIEVMPENARALRRALPEDLTKILDKLPDLRIKLAGDLLIKSLIDAYINGELDYSSYLKKIDMLNILLQDMSLSLNKKDPNSVKSMLDILRAMNKILGFRSSLLSREQRDEATLECAEIEILLAEAKKISKDYQQFELLGEIETKFLFLLLNPTAPISSTVKSIKEKLAAVEEKVFQDLVQDLNDLGVADHWDQSVKYLLNELKQHYKGINLKQQIDKFKEEYLDNLSNSLKNYEADPYGAISAMIEIAVFRHSLVSKDSSEQRINLKVMRALVGEVMVLYRQGKNAENLKEIEDCLLRLLENAILDETAIESCTKELLHLKARAELYVGLNESSRKFWRELEHREGSADEKMLVDLFTSELIEQRADLGLWKDDFIEILQSALNKDQPILVLKAIYKVLEFRRRGASRYISDPPCSDMDESEIAILLNAIEKIQVISPIPVDTLNAIRTQLLTLVLSKPIDATKVSECAQTIKRVLLEHIRTADEARRHLINTLDAESEVLTHNIEQVNMIISNKGRKEGLASVEAEIQAENQYLSESRATHAREKMEQQEQQERLGINLGEKTKLIDLDKQALRKAEEELSKKQDDLKKYEVDVATLRENNSAILKQIENNTSEISRLQNISSSLRAAKPVLKQKQDEIQEITKSITAHEKSLDQIAPSIIELYRNLPSMAAQLIEDINQVIAQHPDLEASTNFFVRFFRGKKAIELAEKFSQLKSLLQDFSSMGAQSKVELETAKEKISKLTIIINSLREAIKNSLQDKSMNAKIASSLRALLDRLEGRKISYLQALNEHKRLEQVVIVNSKKDLLQQKETISEAYTALLPEGLSAILVAEQKEAASLDEIENVLSRKKETLENTDQQIRRETKVLETLTTLEADAKKCSESVIESLNTKASLTQNIERKTQETVQLSESINSIKERIEASNKDLAIRTERSGEKMKSLISKRDSLQEEEVQLLASKEALAVKKAKVNAASCQKRQDLQLLADVAAGMGECGFKNRLQEDIRKWKKQTLKPAIEKNQIELEAIEENLMKERKSSGIFNENLIGRYIEKRLELSRLILEDQSLSVENQDTENQSVVAMKKLAVKRIITAEEMEPGRKEKSEAEKRKEHLRHIRKVVKAREAVIENTLHEIIYFTEPKDLSETERMLRESISRNCYSKCLEEVTELLQYKFELNELIESVKHKQPQNLDLLATPEKRPEHTKSLNPGSPSKEVSSGNIWCRIFSPAAAAIGLGADPIPVSTPDNTY